MARMQKTLTAMKIAGVSLLAAAQFGLAAPAFAQSKRDAEDVRFAKVCRAQIEPYIQFLLALSPNACGHIDVPVMTEQLEKDCATRPLETLQDMRAKILAGILGQYGLQKH